jgi:hypothetical protein
MIIMICDKILIPPVPILLITIVRIRISQRSQRLRGYKIDSEGDKSLLKMKYFHLLISLLAISVHEYYKQKKWIIHPAGHCSNSGMK